MCVKRKWIRRWSKVVCKIWRVRRRFSSRRSTSKLLRMSFRFWTTNSRCWNNQRGSFINRMLSCKKRSSSCLYNCNRRLRSFQISRFRSRNRFRGWRRRMRIWLGVWQINSHRSISLSLWVWRIWLRIWNNLTSISFRNFRSKLSTYNPNSKLIYPHRKKLTKWKSKIETS